MLCMCVGYWVREAVTVMTPCQRGSAWSQRPASMFQHQHWPSLSFQLMNWRPRISHRYAHMRDACTCTHTHMHTHPTSLQGESVVGLWVTYKGLWIMGISVKLCSIGSTSTLTRYYQHMLSCGDLNNSLEMRLWTQNEMFYEILKLRINLIILHL